MSDVTDMTDVCSLEAAVRLMVFIAGQLIQKSLTTIQLLQAALQNTAQEFCRVYGAGRALQRLCMQSRWCEGGHVPETYVSKA